MFLNNNNTLFGLDIGDYALRLVKIKRHGKKNIIVSQNEIKLPAGIIVDGDIKKPEALIKYLNEIRNSVHGEKIQSGLVIVVLPETKTFIKLISVKAESENTIEKTLEKEIVNHIPLTTAEIYFDWQVVGNFRNGQENNILIGAAPKQVVDSYLEILNKAGLTPFVLEIEAAAIVRGLIKEDAKNKNSAKIIIDLGAARTSLAMYRNNAILFTASLPISGQEITSTIADKLKIDSGEAEKAKIVCGLDEKKCKGIIKKILYSNIDQLTEKINEAISYYQEYYQKDDKVDEIILCGGGANFSKIEQVLESRTGIRTKIGNPLTKINKVLPAANINQRKLLSFTTAIGLALRGTKNNVI